MLLAFVRSTIARISASTSNHPAAILAALVAGTALAVVAVPRIAAGISAFVREPRRRAILARLPAPPGLPYFGCGLEAAKYGLQGKSDVFFDKYMAKLGSTISIYSFGLSFVFTCDRDLVRRMLTETNSFYRDEFFDTVSKGLFGHALFVMPSGDTWKRHRKYLQPAFAPAQLRLGFDATKKVMQDVIVHYRNKASTTKTGAAVTEIQEEFGAITLDVIGHVGFSYDFKTCQFLHDGVHNEAPELVSDIMRIVQTRISLPPFLWWMFGLAPNQRRTKTIRDHFRTFFRKMIEEKTSNKDKNASGNERRMDMLDRLLMGAEDGGVFTESEIIGEMLGFFAAGHETTARTLSFAVYELCTHPEHQQRIRDEIEASGKSVEDGTIHADNLHEFKFLDWFIKEIQRLHSIVAMIGRHTSCTVEHNGIIIPEDLIIIAMLTGLHKDPKVYKDPNAFDPDRWATPPPPGSFLPFGDGPMNCIGQKLAIIEIKVVLIMLVNAFELSLVPDQDLTTVRNLTISFKHGLKVSLKPKTHS